MFLLELAVKSSSSFCEYFCGKALENEAAHPTFGRKNTLGFSCYLRELAPGLCGRLGFHLQVLCASTSLRAPSGVWLVATWKIHKFFLKSFFKNSSAA